IFETYDDDDALRAHSESEHFQRLVLDEAVPLLEGRGRAFYHMVAWDSTPHFALRSSWSRWRCAPRSSASGPLSPRFTTTPGLSPTEAGLLGTIPARCMGIFAPAAAYVAGGIGARAAIGLAVALIAAGGLLRVSVADTAVLIAFTLPVGIGIAVAGTLMPSVV